MCVYLSRPLDLYLQRLQYNTDDVEWHIILPLIARPCLFSILPLSLCLSISLFLSQGNPNSLVWGTANAKRICTTRIKLKLKKDFFNQGFFSFYRIWMKRMNRWSYDWSEGLDLSSESCADFKKNHMLIFWYIIVSMVTVHNTRTCMTDAQHNLSWLINMLLFNHWYCW